jgi:hypothetical protein
MALEAKNVQNGRGKPYVAPKLVNYGTVLELTKSVGLHGMPDSGGTGSQIKTTL